MFGTIHNGLRRAHRMVRRNYHIMGRFHQTPDSKREDTRWGPEFTAECKHCGAYILLYFDDARSLEAQSYNPEDHIKLVSNQHGFHMEQYMVVSGNWDRFECGKLKKTR